MNEIMRILFIGFAAISFMAACMGLLWGIAFLFLGAIIKAVACLLVTVTGIMLTIICYEMS